VKDGREDQQAAALHDHTLRAAVRPPRPLQEAPRRTWAQVILNWSNVGVILLLFVISALLSEHFLTVRNVMNIRRAAVP